MGVTLVIAREFERAPWLSYIFSDRLDLPQVAAPARRWPLQQDVAGLPPQLPTCRLLTGVDDEITGGGGGGGGKSSSPS